MVWKKSEVIQMDMIMVEIEETVSDGVIMVDVEDLREGKGRASAGK